MMKTVLMLVAAALLFTGTTAMAGDPENTLYMDLK